MDWEGFILTSSNDFLVLQHNRYVAYAQIWAGLCLAIWAAEFLDILEIRSTLFTFIVLNNWLVAAGLGVAGLSFFQDKLHLVENQVAQREAQSL